MTDHWLRVKGIFQSALDRPEEARFTFVRDACGEDCDLRAEVESLLAAHHATGVLDASVVTMNHSSFDLLGREIGTYRILSLLGTGGMGEVYRARDTKLERDVAVKVLPPAFTSQPDRLARFEREARMLATLNHPHIGAIYGFEETDGVRALVLELVEGETLAEFLARSEGGVSPDVALPIARQIADALEAAHDKGVVHRDLKPANIKIAPDGSVKVLDFGLAKVAGGNGSEPDGTATGVVLGTLLYMSPEQARGQNVDKRTDIWSFGCVLYEMLTGRSAFTAETISDTIAAVIRNEPDWNVLPADLSPTLLIYLRRCLQKNPRDRLHDIADVRLALEGAFEVEQATSSPVASNIAPPHVSRTSSGRWRRLLPVAAATIVAMLAGSVGWLARRPREPRIARTIISAPGFTLGITPSGRELAITPDGTRVIYVGNGSTQLYIRPLDQLEPTPLGPIGKDLTHPFVSPDGEWVGYFDSGTLKKVALVGGPAITLAETGIGLGATWGANGTIILSAFGAPAGLERISASAAGGQRSVITTAAHPRERDHLWPEFLPGGHAVLFTISTDGGADASEVAVHDLRSRQSKVLIRGGSHAHYLASGHLVFAASGMLHAVPFDVARLEVTGAPQPIAASVVTEFLGAVQFAAGRDAFVYAVGTPAGGVAAVRGELVSVTRDGNATSLNLPVGDYGEPRLSPNRQRLAITDGRDIWAYDLTRPGTRVRLTVDGGAVRPAWTPDGTRVTFRSERRGTGDLFSTLADGSAKTESLLVRDSFSGAWSPDGAVLAFDEFDRFGGRDIGLVPKGGTPFLFLATRFSERGLRFSPDGQWVAYVSDESGRDEVYLQPYPGPGQKIPISDGGGREPVWSPEGGELFYRQDRRVIGVSIRASPSLVVGTPKILFEGDYAGNGHTPNYEVLPDGQGFIMIRVAPKAAPSIILVQNWFEELKRLAPSGK